MESRVKSGKEPSQDIIIRSFLNNAGAHTGVSECCLPKDSASVYRQDFTQTVGTHPGASECKEMEDMTLMEERTHRGASLQVMGNGSGSCDGRLRQRKSPRCDFHNYSGGDYFITICTREKEHFFGKIEDGRMLFTEIGKVAFNNLLTLSEHHKYLEIPLFVVMPNHIHAIMCINGDRYCDEMPLKRTALSVIIGSYKQSVTSYSRRNDIKFAWQSRYHDHIIRGTNDGNHIAEYIENNITRWESDCFYPKLETYRDLRYED